MSPRKLLGSLRVKVRVALASLAILVAGALIAPPVTPTVLTPPEERPAPLLDQQAQARVEARPFAGIQDVRARIDDIVVAIPGAGEPAKRRTSVDYDVPAVGSMPTGGFGVVVGPGGAVLTHADAMRGRSEVNVETSQGRVLPARVSGYEPSTGLVLLTLEGLSPPVPTPTFAAPPEAGALAAAYFRAAAQASVVPVFITSVAPETYSIATSGGALKPGTPIYNLAGELLAVAAGPMDTPTALPARQAAERLLARLAAGTAQPASLGLRFQPLDGPIADAFGQTGALVADVVPGGPAAAAGVRPGDLVHAVAADVVDSPEAAHRAIVGLPIGEASTIRVRRGDEMLVLTVTPASAFAVNALNNIARGDDAAATVAVSEVLTPEVLEAAGINSSARLISVNARPVSSVVEARRELRRNAPRAVLHLRAPEGERFFAVLEPVS